MEKGGQMKNSIRDIRQSLKLSQAELAERCGISRQTLSKIENGGEELVVSSKTLLALARELGKPIEELFFENAVK